MEDCYSITRFVLDGVGVTVGVSVIRTRLEMLVNVTRSLISVEVGPMKLFAVVGLRVCFVIS